jgi:FlaA1/EpsC-like NDP-sugar epimerase
LQGDVLSRFRDVSSEDLLERAVVAVDERDLSRFLGGKTVMVTGAGGSIGSELCRQIARHGPSRLLLVERAEGALFNIDRELKGAWPDVPVVPFLADVGDRARMQVLFAGHRPEIVAHAAAHKHVPMMELHPCEAIKNNVLATRVLAELAGDSGVECFILVSSDKAVRPSSVMGASKRFTELVVQELDRRYPTRYVAVRFGNVLGSAGSVIPLFREQIEAGGPVTVTHPDMTRYFMTVPEASSLVLEAAAMGQGGEIFVLDMGQPVKVLDLAKRLIELSGYKPFEDIPIVFTGVRPGEKLFEELSLKGEELAKTRHPKIFIGNIVGPRSEDLAAALARLGAVAEAGSPGEIRDFLNASLREARLEGVGARA